LFSKESAMSTVFSSTPASLGLNPTATAATNGSPRARSRFDGSRGLAAMLLAAVVAALVVLADQMISTWADRHLFLGWVALWVVIFAGSALFAGTARRMASVTLQSLDSWSRSLAEARAEARLWELAKLDPRLKDELMQARARSVAEADAAAEPVVAAHDFTQVLAPLGLESGMVSAASARRFAQMEIRRHAGYLPYL
jgi:hypothetical protein